MKLPAVPAQKDEWSCGVHNASRLLKHHAQRITYSQLKAKAQPPVISFMGTKFTVGLTPNDLKDLIGKYVDPKTVQCRVGNGSLDTIKLCL